MDPVSAISLAASLVSIGDVLAKSVRRLIDLQSRYRSASLIVSLLIGQLTTLKAAVNQITEWVTSSLFNTPKHEQVVADLETSLESCKLLILVLEDRISQLERDDSGGLNVKGKIWFLWDEPDLKEFSNHLSNQANALNLLLTALHCRTAFERNALLQDDESRRIIKRVEENRASLLSLRDSTSENTRRSKLTDNSNLLDTEFDFDQDVITTSVYRAALRSNLQKATQKGISPGLPSEILGGFDSIPEVVKSPWVFSGNLQESEPGSSGKEPTLQSPQALLGFKRWFQTDGGITQTTEIDQFSTRLSRLSRLSDDISVLSSESQERGDEGRPGQSILASQDAAQDKQLEPNNRKRRGKTYRIRNIFMPYSSVDLQKSPAPLVPDPLVLVDGEVPKVLVLGSGNSGKSTLCKSMDALCKGGWTIEERLRFQETVFTNTIQNMKDILKAMDTLGILLDADTNYCHAHTIIHHPSALSAGTFPPDACNALEALWEDGGVRRTFERSNEYILQDAAAYFFGSLRRIGEPGYIPTDEDVIMARIRSTGLYPMKLSSGGLSFKLIDTGGERSERKKWIHALENVSIVIFTVDISAYDLALYEDLNASRLVEDIVLFESISNSKWFENSQIILLFTKMDILEAKLRKVSIKTYCPDFPGSGESLKDVKSYMKDRFLALIKDSKRIVTTIFASFVGGYDSSAKLVLDAIVSQLSSSPEMNGFTV